MLSLSLKQMYRGLTRVLCFFILSATISVPPAEPQARERPWRRHTIDVTAQGADGVRLADINKDGLPDVVTAWAESGLVRVYLHPGPELASEAWPSITVGRVPDAEDAVFADLDGDGVLDVVSFCQGEHKTVYIHWAPSDINRLLDESAWQTRAVPASRGQMLFMVGAIADIDQRFGEDILVGGKFEGARLGWFQRPVMPRIMQDWRWVPMRQVGWIMSILSLDMDGDGDNDILYSDRAGPSSGVAWLENRGETRLYEPWPRHQIGAEGSVVMSLTVFDLDNDGLTDILTAVKDRRIMFHRRRAAHGLSWQNYTLRIPEWAAEPRAIKAGDINLDGKVDLAMTSEEAGQGRSGVLWLSYQEHPADYEWRPHEVSGPTGQKYDLLELVDIDRDGDLDILTCEEGMGLGVVWYENPTRSLPSPVPSSKSSPTSRRASN